jgi:hypothetical protein
MLKLLVSRWSGQSYSCEEILDPSTEALVAAIKALNNEDLNDIHLHVLGDSPSWLCVGGGGGDYIVAGETSDGQHLALNESARQSLSGTVELVVGGQLATYPLRETVSRDRAIEAASNFLKNSGFAKCTDWRDS